MKICENHLLLDAISSVEIFGVDSFFRTDSFALMIVLPPIPGEPSAWYDVATTFHHV